MPASVPAPRVAAVRRFNRLYTKRLGLLSRGHLDSPYSLTEVRVLYELAHRSRPTASELRAELGLDAGYLSRMLARFERLGLITRTPAKDDARRSLLALTARGRREFAPLDRRASAEVAALLERIPVPMQQQLTAAMGTLEQVLEGAAPAAAGGVTLRAHRPGDIGWVIERHGALYAKEYGWDARFEATVAEIAAAFLRRFDPARERCWIAELDGRRVGSVFLVKRSATVAQLRLLLVEPEARGHGIGRRLVAECTTFARRAGYRRIRLWTNQVLTAARHLYREAGYRVIAEETHRDFGPKLVSETWELTL